ncbi:hypothetical protein RRF57_004799 [Xylaria bambusicola]|uniref:Uncharacterized protein n=1 Tax=Xylaria bambusicola TaxID=326684 RepID=A0AAN7UNS0_9PEZI
MTFASFLGFESNINSVTYTANASTKGCVIEDGRPKNGTVRTGSVQVMSQYLIAIVLTSKSL